MSDLLVTSHTPTLGVGRALRTYALARALATHAPLDLLYVPHGAAAPSPEFLAHPEIRLHAVTPSRGVRRGLAYVTARAAGTPDALARGVSAELGAAAARLAAQPGRGRVIADGMTVFMALRHLGRPVIFNGHNLESAFQHQLGREALGSQSAMARFERKVFGRAAEVWMVSEADIAGARKLCPAATVRYVPNVVDVAATAPVDPLRTRRVLLVADYTWPPNAGAVRFLLDDVMPRVWATMPDVRLALAGRGLTVNGAVDPRVETLGFVDDLDAEYARAACAVVPLFVGGGSPLKFLEALAHALPVVATSVAARGLDLVAGEHYIQADGPDAFAAALARVLRDGAERVGAAGRAHVERRYSIDALAQLVAPEVAA